jgi:hypothetical protein
MVCHLITAHGEMYTYLIQLHVMKFESDMQQVGALLHVLWLPIPIKLMATILTEILLIQVLYTM